MVWRTVVVEGTAVLRIVDIIGSTEWLADARRALTSEVVAADAEYLDLMQCGIDPDIIDAGGFVGIRTHPDIVIPNYFAPFERRNIQIDLAYKRIDDDADRPLHLYRADSDQDRPNSLAEVRG